MKKKRQNIVAGEVFRKLESQTLSEHSCTLHVYVRQTY